MASRPLGAYLDDGEAAGHLMSHAAVLLRLRRIALPALPAPIRRSVEIASLKQGTVVIFAENNAIAAKLRLLAPNLIDLWGRSGMQVNAIRVSAQATTPSREPAPPKSGVSPGAARALEDLAEQLPQTPLRDAVRSLAAKARK